jgi:hypothetical protein
MKEPVVGSMERAAIIWERANGDHIEYAVLPERPVTIGREMRNTIVIESPFVSKAHALLQYQNGQYVLEDLESANGTRVNGHHIDRVVLRPGDLVEFGDQRFAFVEAALEATTDRPGLSKGTKLVLAAAGTATLMIILLGLLVSSAPSARSRSSTPVDPRVDIPPQSSPIVPSGPSPLVDEVISRADRAGVKRTDALFDEAHVQFRSGRLREARDLLRAVLAADSGHPLAGGRLRAAEERLADAISGYGAEAQTAFARLRYDAAIAAWEQVLLLAEPEDARHAAARDGIQKARTKMLER